MPCIFSVDVEDWFHILDVPSAPPLAEWETLPARVEPAFQRLLDLFDEHGAKVTCFFLGWVAERFPQLVREAHGRGHEIASHGYAHELVYRQTAAEFRADVVRARVLLENLTGQPVLGYRSPGFSVVYDTPWFFEELVRAGYRYDSSVFPASRGHGGMLIDEFGPHLVSTASGPLIEVPISVAPLLGKRLCFFGGGYLRLFPYFLIRRMTQQVLEEGRPVVFYVHPRELDPDHPRLPMSWQRRFKSYVNLHTTEKKVRRLLVDFRPVSFQDYLTTCTRLFEDLPCPLPVPLPSSTATPVTSTRFTGPETPMSTV